ncbi:MAG: DNA mismatch repair protein MutS [Planctomycetota bacterium]
MPTAAAKAASEKPKKLTPAMRQHAAFKEQHPGCVLFFRMGDFYECFHEDAEIVSRELGLAKVERSPGVPMAGVPQQKLDDYLRRAVAAGLRVAVCEQIQDPAEAKGVVARAVTQVATPGTLTGEGLLADEELGALAAVAALPDTGLVPVALVEASTGRFVVIDITSDRLGDELSRRGVGELIYPEATDGETPAWVSRLISRSDLAATPRASWHFRYAEALEAATNQFGVRSLAGFGLDDADPAVPAVGAIVRYLRETQGADARPELGGTGSAADDGPLDLPNVTLAHLRPPVREDPAGAMAIDASTLRSLEIERTIRGSEIEGSVLGVFLRTGSGCRTAMGKRTLRDWLVRPLASHTEIESRHRAVAALLEDRRASSEIATALAGVGDLPRMGARVALGRASPRDVVGLGRGVLAAEAVLAASTDTPALSALHTKLKAAYAEANQAARAVTVSCVNDPPPHLRDGGLVREGVDAELDEARSLSREAGTWLAEYQAKLADEFDLPNLKVGFNRVFGYYIELPAGQASRAPDSFVRKQTLKNAERYITPDLKGYEDRVLGAEQRALERERAIFNDLCAGLRSVLPSVTALADALGELDALLCFARKAADRRWVRPEITEEPTLVIREGRHPVLDELLEGEFVPNGCELGEPDQPAKLALITGPNMAGKSTYIRQVALISLLAHAGSFVPAEVARLGLIDRLFARVGADDALHQGQSTFMVEMTETANILNNATGRSLVILDEIGRGTSTLDGLSLAWAIAEDLSDRGTRTLFATHYHELTTLAEEREGRVRNLHVEVREWKPEGSDSRPGQAEIVFLHRILPGRAEASYGVHVARLAGVPERVSRRAADVLSTLAVQHGPSPAAPKKTENTSQLGLFTEYVPHPALDRLREVKLEELSPLAAFDLLRELKDRATGAG